MLAKNVKITKNSFPPNRFASNKADENEHVGKHSKCKEGNVEKRENLWDFNGHPACQCPHGDN